MSVFPKHLCASFAFNVAADNNQPEALNKKALTIITRVRDKLTGRDFSHEETLSVRQQVDLLIQQATNNENLCQCYIGWCVIIYNYVYYRKNMCP